MALLAPLSPAGFLAALAALTALAAAGEAISRRQRKRILRKLAGRWRMNYSARDHLRLTPKVAAAMPIPGAADVLVRDVIYGVEAAEYRYVFTVEFTIGAVDPKHRRVRVGFFWEPRDSGAEKCARVVLAPDEGTLLAQFEQLSAKITRS